MTSKFWEQLDAANDELEVRRRIAEGLYNQPNLGIAQEWIRRKDQAREKVRYDELLAEIRRPHWSVTPLFWVSVVAAIAACIAAYPVLFPQAQQSAASNQPVLKVQSSLAGSSANSPPPSTHSPAAQTGTTTK